MSYVYTGSGLWVPSATLVQDGEVWNETTVTVGILEKLFDRTSYLKNKLDGSKSAWAKGSITAGGATTIDDSEGISSITVTGVTDINVTFATAFANAHFAVSAQLRLPGGSGGIPFVSEIKTKTTTTCKLNAWAAWTHSGFTEGNIVDIGPGSGASLGVAFDLIFVGRAA